jgi:hypothetical protein
LFFANSGKFLQKNSPRTPHTKHTPNTNPQKVHTVHIIQGRNYEFLGQLEGCPPRAGRFIVQYSPLYRAVATYILCWPS